MCHKFHECARRLRYVFTYCHSSGSLTCSCSDNAARCFKPFVPVCFVPVVWWFFCSWIDASSMLFCSDSAVSLFTKIDPVTPAFRGGACISDLNSDSNDDDLDILSTAAGTFMTRKVKGDGRCLFRSLSVLLYGTQESYQCIIDQIIDHVLSRWDEFKCFVEAGHGGFGAVTSETSYADYMRRPSTYGTLAEIAAASAVMNRRIVVITEAGGTLFDTSVGLTSLTSGKTLDNPLMLCLAGNISSGHYQPLFPVYHETSD